TEAAPKSGAMLKPFGLMLLSLRKSKGRTVLTTVTFALVIVVFHVMMMTDIAEYRSDSAYKKADASLTALEIYDSREGGFLWQDSEKTKAIPVSVFSDVRASLEAVCQNASVIPMFYCSIPFSRYDSYLNGHFHFDYKMLGLRNWERWGQYNYSFEKQTRYGYTAQEYLTEPRITIFDDFLLEQFRPYVTDGAINIEEIRQGEEIVLCMPDYYSIVREEENGLQVEAWVSDGKTGVPKDARLLTNTSWAAGDTLIFTWIKRQGNDDIRHERTVKIGAIVKGAPQVENSSGGVFCMAVGQDTLENLEMPYQISRVYVYFAEDADIPAAEDCLEEMASRLYPLTRLSTRTEEALADRQQRNTRLAVSGMIAACLLILGFLGLMNTVCSRIHSRLHEIGLLRCIGMTKGQIYRMFVYEGIVFGVLASLLGTGVSLWILPKYRENWLHTQMPFYIILSCSVCIALSVLTVFLPAGAVLRKNPTEITRINEYTDGRAFKGA
ncbi:MAG: ABC transporter permease, partial [Lachnospiraceae bacterium]|nr:ABC transporter permease [Lachnospiraceae bacterium]